jgi:hypothetical protein
MKFSIFVTSYIRMEWIKSSYEDKYIIFKEIKKKKIKNIFYKKKFHAWRSKLWFNYFWTNQSP